MASARGVKILSPAGAIKSTGTWSRGARAGDFVFIAGMRGIEPASNTILGTEEERIRRAFTNMKTIAESEGATLTDCVRLTIFVTDMNRLRPMVNKVQGELWAGLLIRRPPSWRSPDSTRTTFSRWKARFTSRKQRDLQLLLRYIYRERSGSPLKRTEISWASSNSSTMK
jgi:2-iminobutanoate/2-iminopropanoate deaminase